MEQHSAGGQHHPPKFRIIGQRIDRITDDRRPEPARRVHADLMGPPRGRAKLNQALPIGFGDPPPMRRRRLAALVDNHSPAALGRRKLGHWQFDPALVSWRLTVQHREIGLGDFAPLKRLLERVVGDPNLSGTHERAPDGFVMAVVGRKNSAT